MNGVAPQPCRWSLPCNNSSKPPSGLARLSDAVMRLFVRGTLAMKRLAFIDANQGPTQLLRPASVLVCDVRHLLTDDGPFVIKSFRPCDNAASLIRAGSKTNARS